LIALGVVVAERPVGGIALEALERADRRWKAPAQRPVIWMARPVAVYQYIGVAGHHDLAEPQRPAWYPISVDVEGDLRSGLLPYPRVVIEEQAQIDAAPIQYDSGRGELEVGRADAAIDGAPWHNAALTPDAIHHVVVATVPSGFVLSCDKRGGT